MQYWWKWILDLCRGSTHLPSAGDSGGKAKLLLLSVYPGGGGVNFAMFMAYCIPIIAYESSYPEYLSFDIIPSGRVDGFHPLCFFPYSSLSSYLLGLFLYLISFMLFPCASVWENTRAWVPYFLYPYRTVLAFFSDIATISAQCVFGAETRNSYALVNLCPQTNQTLT